MGPANCPAFDDMQTNKMAEVLASDQEAVQIYWHAVYKLSDLLSPREEIKV